MAAPPPLTSHLRRLVIGGGHAADYPRLRGHDFALDRSADAQPDLVADARAIPLPSGHFRVVYFECIPFPVLTTHDGAALDEAARMLRPGGLLRIDTGALAPTDEIAAQLRRLGLSSVRVIEREGMPLRIAARRPLLPARGQGAPTLEA